MIKIVSRAVQIQFSHRKLLTPFNNFPTVNWPKQLTSNLTKRARAYFSDQDKGRQSSKINPTQQTQDKAKSTSENLKKENNDNNSNNNNRDKPPPGQNNLEKLQKKLFGLLIAILFGGSVEYEKGIIGPYIIDFKQRQFNKYKYKKGRQIIEQAIQKDKLSHKYEDDLKEFQCTDTDQERMIEKIVNFTDHKVIQYIEAYAGNGLATNLKRYILKKRYKQIDENEKKVKENTYLSQIQVPGIDPSEDSFHNLDINKQNGYKVTQLYFQDLKDLSISSKDSPCKWGNLQKLHNLLTYLIQNGKSSEKKQILVIEDIHLLAQSFQSNKEKKENINELFKQIMHINKKEIAKVILISSNYFFYNKYLKRLESINLHSIKKETTKQLIEKDLQNVVKTRMAFNKLSTYLSQAQINDINKIIKEMVGKTDCVKQLMRILTLVKLDTKKLFIKYRDQQKDKAVVTLDDYMKNKWQNYIDKDQEKLKITIKQCQNVIETIQKHIVDSVSILDDNLDAKTLQKHKNIQIQKIKILNDVFNGKYKNEQAINDFNLQYDEARLQAFRELNNDQILFGFQFSSQSKKLAYIRALNKNSRLKLETKEIPSIKWYRKLQRWWSD